MRHTYSSVIYFPTMAGLGFDGILPLGGLFGSIGMLVIGETFELLIADVDGICVSLRTFEYKNWFLHVLVPRFVHGRNNSR
jgi:hypothetical protein